MKLQGTNYNNSYLNSGVHLAKSDEKKVNKLLVDLSKTKEIEQADMLKSKLLDVFDKHFEKETNKHSVRFIHKDDFQQNLYLKFLVMLEQVRTKAIEPLSFIEEFNKIVRPTKDERREKEHSIDTTIVRDSHTRRLDFLTDDNLPVYDSSKSPEEIRLIKRETKNVLKDSILKEKERFVLDKKSQGVTFVDMEAETGRSRTRMRQHYIAGLMKLKQKNNTTPENVKEMARIVGVSEEEFVKIASRQPQIFSYKPDVLKNFINKSAEILEISEQEFTKMFLRQPSICCSKPERFKQNLVCLSNLFGVGQKDIMKAALRQPQVLYYPIDSLLGKVETNSKALGFSEQEFIKVALKLPQLFYMSPDTLSKNIKETSEILGVSQKDFMKAVARQPQLACQRADTLKQNVFDMAKLLQVPENEVIKVALKHAPLFYGSVETYKTAIAEKSKLFGVSEKVFIKAAMQAPTLFAMKIETLQKNIEKSAKMLEISEQDFVNTALRHPTVFYIKPETIEQNIIDSAKKFGISKEAFISAVIKTPMLAYSSPETLKKNISESAQMIGVPEKELVEFALQKPVLFTLKPENVAKKFKALDFYANFKKTANKKKLYNAVRNINCIYNNTFTYIIKKDLKDTCKVTQNNIFDVLNAIPARNFHFDLPEHEMAEEFAQYVKEHFAQNYSKHTCSFAINGKIV